MADIVTSNGLCTAENCGQRDSPENMVGIRTIMVEQESLFKEQVQELHRLYKVQKLEMQELENKKNHLTLETAELTDGFSSISQLEDKSGALVRPVARVYKPETGSLSLHPFCSLKLFESSGSVSFGGSFQRPDGSQSKRVKDFDLETFPEGWVDESSLVIQADDSCPTSKESEIACVEGNQGSSPEDAMDGKPKLSHQGSFASVNGSLNYPSSEGEESNSKITATWTLKTYSKRVEDHASEGLQSSELTSGAAHLISYRKTGFESPLANGEENEYTQVNRAAGTLPVPAPNNSISVQQLPAPSKTETDAEASDFHASSNESSNPSKRKHLNGLIATKDDDKLMKFSKSAKMFPSRSTP